MLKFFFFLFWEGLSTWDEDKLTTAVNESRVFKNSEATLRYTTWAYVSKVTILFVCLFI